MDKFPLGFDTKGIYYLWKDFMNLGKDIEDSVI